MNEQPLDDALFLLPSLLLSLFFLLLSLSVALLEEKSEDRGRMECGFALEVLVMCAIKFTAK
eukprot:scaffold15538_cov88-Attheya_sp.AAC.4